MRYMPSMRLVPVRCRPCRALGTTRWAHEARATGTTQPHNQDRQPQLAPDSGKDANANKAPVIRRFWRDVSVGERDGDYVVLLDKRPIKTPDGKLMRIPQGQRVLAWLVAGEWESQKEILGAHSLLLTSLVSRSIDGLSDANMRADVINKLLNYFRTDSVCLNDTHPRALVDLQQKYYSPIIDWARSTYDIDVQTTTNIFALHQQNVSIERLREVASEFSPLKLAALERAVMSAKSFLIGLALVQQHITVEDAAMAAQAEANSQTQLWGELENAHDLDNAAMRQVLGASACAVIDI
ncbi:ATP synthase mitochondrial F1 complex assembly factor 2 [Coemansia guatemalensis]|uniref:ATP synthase mitochondrial F1 complex assembly factor 2 n=1 Tax=Coemansia guatemalensis TaxID=2761395 RepID=A0A9W8LUW3_9FUNG|nr:ATP synthase mitochondrial F1 complex assembly factor 2 [Coemansia guatemalensis]